MGRRVKFTDCFTKRSAMLDVTITVNSFCSFTVEELQNDAQPCPTVPYVCLYVFMSVPIILLRFLLKLKFLNTKLKNRNMPNIMKSIQVRTDLLSTDR